MFAALGGMLMPGMLYTLFNLGSEGRLHGWAIPAATDIAFSLGILALLGNRVPDGVKVFLAALAIVDDLGAIVIIGLFYSSDLQTEYLALGFGIVGLMAALNYLGARRIIFYLVPGIVLWYAFWRAGIHPTLAGVITAFAIPNNFNLSREALGDYCGHRVQDLAQGLQNNSLSRREFTEEIENLFARVATPAQKLEFNLGWVVPFLIMPLFAFANTGIVLTPASVQGLFSPVGIGIVVGLFIGKPLGIYLLSLLVIRIGWGRLPDGVTKAHLLGAGMLAGIGFTMSIFVSGLAFTEYELKEAAKLGILLGSILSGVLGLYFLSRTARKGR
jgi:NhaA family Na+:H+ antiporter